MMSFWTILIIVLVVMLTRLTPARRQSAAETPLQRLQRRYASGELTTTEYDERRRHL